MMFKYYKNDKEFEQDKAIEEMTDYIFGNAITHDTQFKEDCRSIAIDLYNAGYRKIPEGGVIEKDKAFAYMQDKIPENAVVLTDDEYERWQGQTLNIKKVRKETAEKFKKVLESKLHPLVKGWDYFWYNQYEVHNAIRETCKEIIGEEK